MSNHFANEEEADALKKTFAEVSPDYFKEEKKEQAKVIPLVRKYWLPTVGIAAAILILLVFNPLQGTLYDRFVEFPTAAFIEQGNSESTLVQAQQAFNQGNYELALGFLQLHLDQEANKDDVEVQFYLGLSYLALDNYTQASSIFQSIQKGRSAYKNEGIWFLAMISLKQKNWRKCQELLEQIPVDYDRKDEVQRLLKKIRNKN